MNDLTPAPPLEGEGEGGEVREGKGLAFFEFIFC
jgi:hypothetical protein